MKYEIRSLGFSQLWGEAFNLYTDNFFSLSIIAALSNIPYLFFRLAEPINPENPDPSQFLNLFLWVVFAVVLSSLSSALMVEFISQRYLGKEHQLSTYISRVLPMILPIIGLSLMVSLIVGMGFMLFILPGIIFSMSLSLAVEILIVERIGVFASIKRSFKLTEGEKVTIFYHAALLFILSLMVIQIFTMLFIVFNGSEASASGQQFVALLAQILVMPLNACVFILIYFNIRIKKEAFHLEHMVDQYSEEHSE